ncbi:MULTISPECIES: hypothetical protein [unclassified Streptomyces]|nr:MULTISPECIES: hypothetical protein [unclassified Streptomyces]
MIDANAAVAQLSLIVEGGEGHTLPHAGKHAGTSPQKLATGSVDE